MVVALLHPHQPNSQAAWTDHKQVHASARAAQAPLQQQQQQQQQPQLPWLYCTHRGRGRSAAMPSFGWTGPLRPHVIAPPRLVPPQIPRPDYAETGYPESEVESKQQRSS
jgi:hypothetical protein